MDLTLQDHYDYDLLRLLSRFIFRYYALQEQIQRLDSAVEGTGDKQRDDQEDTRASDKQQGHDTQNHKEVTTLPADSTGEATAQPTVAIEGTDGQQEGPLSSEEAAEHAIPQSAEDADYHAVPTSEAQVLEEEDDYQSTNREVGDTTAEGVLDADQIHGSADTDQATTFPGMSDLAASKRTTKNIFFLRNTTSGKEKTWTKLKVTYSLTTRYNTILGKIRLILALFLQVFMRFGPPPETLI
ncbi:hypothetical protein EDC04DRAFT_824625 [Pisolithus marmoratus]|nr:hypothetical protein EDC04DRAFT_824625 [Pisolithus marmoratus]